MNPQTTCTIEYIAKQIELGISKKILDLARRPITSTCLYCTPESRCDYYIPLIRIQNIRDKEILYRRKYNKE